MRSPVVRMAAVLLLLALPAAAKIRGKAETAAGAAIEVSATLADAVKAVEEVAADPIVYGTYVYERDKTLSGARAVDVSSAFGNERPEGKVFYKVLEDVLAPRHFKDAEDSGTITVRYVVREVSAARVSIRVDAVFVESARRAVHGSQGAVESAEFGQVQQHLDRIQARQKEAEEEAAEEKAEEEKAEQAKAEQAKAAQAKVEVGPAAPGITVGEGSAASPAPADALRAESASSHAQGPYAPGSHAEGPAPEAAPAAASGSVEELEQRVNQLRHQVEARVKAPGAALKSAPFHTATTIETVPPNAEVAVVILTAYWYGVQTTDGHTGWIQRSQLEDLP